MNARSDFLRELKYLGLLLVVLVGCFFWLSRSEEILLVDRPRPDSEPADFVLQFLDKTDTPYTLEEGYIVLKGDALVQKRLLQLLADLSIALQVVEENQRTRVYGNYRPRLRCQIDSDGSVDIVAEESPFAQGVEAVEKDRELSESLRQQYDTVLTALQALRPEVVGTRDGSWRAAQVLAATREPPARASVNTVPNSSGSFAEKLEKIVEITNVKPRTTQQTR